MRYYVMEPPENMQLPAAAKSEGADVVQTSGLDRFSEIDYDSRCGLISDRMKLLMERFLLRYDFKPVVFLDSSNGDQLVFWRFSPAIYEDCSPEFRNDGIVSHVSFPNNDAPIVFTVRSPKGVRSILVRMAVAESTLRRSILGLKFTKVSD
ncbi:MAG: hypothetical protein FWG53_00050 [Clostridiales bacterium]|nr:hypothetical protein [Clostridiales bacterium]